MNFLLEVTDYTKPIENAGDMFSFGLQMLLIGMATVFSVLIIIWFALVAFKFFFHDLPARRAAESKEVAVSAPAPVSAAPVPVADGEIVAVIAAAIAMAESEGNGAKFRVVSFRRK